MESIERTEEAPYRIKINQSAKGYAVFEVSVRAEDEVLLSKMLKQAVEIARCECELLNTGIKN